MAGMLYRHALPAIWHTVQNRCKLSMRVSISNNSDWLLSDIKYVQDHTFCMGATILHNASLNSEDTTREEIFV